MSEANAGDETNHREDEQPLIRSEAVVQDLAEGVDLATVEKRFRVEGVLASRLERERRTRTDLISI
jgi:hypothetical protein